MRCKRMRGYGSWCMGWREGERLPPGPSGNGGCVMAFVYGFLILLAFTFFKVGIESGNGLAFIFGLAVIAGLLKKNN
jgi:hypothetical protein